MQPHPIRGTWKRYTPMTLLIISEFNDTSRDRVQTVKVRKQIRFQNWSKKGEKMATDWLVAWCFPLPFVCHSQQSFC